LSARRLKPTDARSVAIGHAPFDRQGAVGHPH
jgi:hypothetical protein